MKKSENKRMGIFVFRRKTPRGENIYPPEVPQLVTFSSVKGIPIPNEKVIKKIEWVYSFSGGKPPGGKTYTRPNYHNL
jgi:hypothetical protein